MKKTNKFAHDADFSLADSEEDFRVLTEEEIELYEKKKKDYVGGKDPFGNFNRVANILTNYPEINPAHPLFVAAFGILKHFDCVLHALEKNRNLKESLRERLKDISVFAKLMVNMLDSMTDILPLAKDGDVSSGSMGKEVEESSDDSDVDTEDEEDREEDDDEDSDEEDDDTEEETEDEEKETRVHRKRKGKKENSARRRKKR